MKANTKILTKSIALFLSLFLVSAYANADRYNGELSNTIFASYEANGTDYISTVGVAVNLLQSNDLGVQFNSSIGSAEVLATDGYLEEYAAWQVGVKAGYFGKISVFFEAGYDLTEAIFNDSRDEGNSFTYVSGDGVVYEEYSNYRNNDVDVYVGAGVGIKLNDRLSIDGIVRVRAIDGDYWEAESEIFSGLQVSLGF